MKLLCAFSSRMNVAFSWSIRRPVLRSVSVRSIDRQMFLNNVIALAKTARAFGLPIVVSTSATKVYSDPLMPAIQAALPGVVSLERRNMNVWEDEAACNAILKAPVGV